MWYSTDISTYTDTYGAFRGTFVLSEPQRVAINVLGSNWFNLLLDGEFLTQGPYRFPPSHPEYETLRMDLPVGRHVLAAIVRAEGVSTRLLQGNIIPPFLMCQVHSESGELAVDWKCLHLKGFVQSGQRINPQFAWIEWCDTRKNPVDWHWPDFDDRHWSVPLPMKAVESWRLRPVSVGYIRQTPIQPKLILQLHITFTDGTTDTIVSNGRWRTAPGPVTFSSIYGGEDYDALDAIPNWNKPEFNDIKWNRVIVTHGPGGVLTPQMAPPVKVMRIYQPIHITHPKPGVTVYDLGQNIAGRFVIQARGPAGSKLVVYPSELLHPNGTEWQSCAGPIWCTYTLDGNAVEAFHPFFAYYGFRYIQIDTLAAAGANANNKPVVLSVIGQATHTSSPTVGRFSCSNKLLNQINHLITMAMVNNMASIITDCPTREKTGWLEDTYLVGPGIMDNYFVPKLYEQTAANMRDAQWPNGMVPDFAPEYFNYPGAFTDSPEWGSACVIDPWLTYQYFGDKRILAHNYQMMTHYVHYLKSRAKNDIVAYGLGDWFDLGPGAPGFEQLTSLGVTATATWYRDLTILVKIATLLGHPAAAGHYATEARQVRTAFNRKFYHPATGQYDRGSQCANAMALATGIVKRADKSKVLADLIANIRKHGDHTTAGDIGFHYVVQALMDANQNQLLYKMVTQTTPPSYGYQIAHGATALTEAWNCNAGDSQDHFMLGHIEQWFFQGLGGIRLDMARKPGRQLEIRPAVVGNLKWVQVRYHSVLGNIISNWRYAGNRLVMHIVIPPSITARIYIPTSDLASVTINGKPPAQSGIKILFTTSGRMFCTVPGGVYRISAAF